MMQFSRIEQSRAHLALSRALGEGDGAQGIAARARQSYAYWASHDPALLFEAGLLAEALAGHAQRQDFCFSISELAIAAGSLDIAECAAGLIGAVRVNRDLWSTAPTSVPEYLSIPKTLLRDLLELWACSLPFDDDLEE